MSIFQAPGSYSVRWGITPCVLALMVLNTALFVAFGMIAFFARGLVPTYLGLSVSGLMLGRLWQPLTYMFLHANPMHLLFNMFSLYMFGRELERTVGARRFLTIYFLSGIVGGLAWVAITYPRAGLCIGASGAIFGVLASFAVLYPDATMMIFPFPVAIKARYLVAGIAFIEFLYLISPGQGDIAYAAHLAGALGGFVYTMTVFRPGVFSSWLGAKMRRPPRPHAAQPDVDRILDKIAAQGIHSLSERERKILEQASDRKSGR
jgi:membrane associated rhomboid family serine protease